MKKVNWPTCIQMNEPFRKIHILHFIDSTGHGGAESVLKTIISGLDRFRFKSYVLLADQGWLYDQLNGMQDVTIIIFNGKGRVNFKLIKKIRFLIRKYHIDLIHSHLFGSSLYSNLSTFFLKVPVISTLHGIPDWRPDDFFNRIKLKIIFNRSKTVVFVSEYLKRYFEERASSRHHNLICIYNGVPFPQKFVFDITKYKMNLGLSAKDILVASVGNIKLIKGYDVLLKAAKNVVSKFPNVKFVVAGDLNDSTYNNLLDMRTEFMLESNFIFSGYQKNTELLYRAANLFVLPSISEGFSLAVIEAMSHKLPIIATKSGGPEEILEDGKTGRLIEKNSPMELGKAIIEILEDTTIRRNLSENAYRSYLNRFSENIMIEKYQKLYIKHSPVFAPSDNQDTRI